MRWEELIGIHLKCIKINSEYPINIDYSHCAFSFIDLVIVYNIIRAIAIWKYPYKSGTPRSNDKII